MIKTAQEIFEIHTYTLLASTKYPLHIFQKNGNIWKVNVQHPKHALVLLQKLKDDTPYKLCGTYIDDSNYYITTINSVSKENHAWLWEIFNGPIPEDHQIEHIDNKHSNHYDNRLSNLRLVARTLKRNTSGYPGVHQDGKDGSWIASIRIPWLDRPEKSFKTKEEAIVCRRVMELFINENFNGVYAIEFDEKDLDLNAWNSKNPMFLEWKRRKMEK